MREFIETVTTALARSTVDAKRLFHGRGQCYPGFEHITVDRYGDVLWLTLFRAPEESFLTQLEQGLCPQLAGHGIFALGVSHRYQQGAPSEWLWQRPAFEPEAQRYAQRGQLRFAIQLGGRQNTGFFLDMEPGRQWLEQRAQGKRVLNLFAYTCAFSVVAAAAGAAEVVNVDMARGALKTGQKNQQLNAQLGPSSRCKQRYLAENILKSWGRIRRPGPYDILIIDPPSYQKGSFVANSDYAKVLRRIPQLANTGADLLLCLNAPELGEAFIADTMAEACPECVKIARLEPSADFPDRNPDQQLKLFHYRYKGAGALPSERQ
ncbi:MAG: class I SAM-dependent methyltransferase [Cellvibrionaceae bacterium]|nr:class I SAM-dependent methyltransferase [Cellvibrionaceae bacterium]